MLLPEDFNLAKLKAAYSRVFVRDRDAIKHEDMLFVSHIFTREDIATYIINMLLSPEDYKDYNYSAHILSAAVYDGRKQGVTFGYILANLYPFVAEADYEAHKGKPYGQSYAFYLARQKDIDDAKAAGIEPRRILLMPKYMPVTSKQEVRFNVIDGEYNVVWHKDKPAEFTYVGELEGARRLEIRSCMEVTEEQQNLIINTRLYDYEYFKEQRIFKCRDLIAHATKNQLPPFEPIKAEYTSLSLIELTDLI